MAPAEQGRLLAQWACHATQRESMKGLIKSLESAPVGEGDLVEQPFKVLPYRRKFLDGAFNPGILRAGITLG